jgi:hypothetical protein
MGIMRMGYAHVRVTDLAEAKNHYANTLASTRFWKKTAVQTTNGPEQ